MKILPVSKIAELDAYTIQHEPIASIDLMERASKAFVKRFEELALTGTSDIISVDVFVGPGNNGGDALAIARLLPSGVFKVKVWIVTPETKMSKDARVNLDLLKGERQVDFKYINQLAEPPEINSDSIIIDGLFGSGLNRPLSGWFKNVVQYINKSGNRVVAIDVPSGLMGEDNSTNDLQAIVCAAETISFQLPKLSFLLAEYEEFVGEWYVEDIGLHHQKTKEIPSQYCFSTNEDISKLLRSRKRFAHKGQFGHALLMAGSYGKMGANILASKACLKSGVGLLTTHVPRLGYGIIQTSVPEAMASIDRSDILISEHPAINEYSAIGIGPGIGIKPNTQTALKELLNAIGDKALVLDADAINIISECEECLAKLPKNTVLTPHPGELDRLLGKSHNAFERLQKTIDFARKHEVVVILKGAYSVVVDIDGHCHFNSTGNPGMATAGSGDVLTGIVLAFLAQRYSSIDAARLAAYLHGLAGDLFVEQSSLENLVAGDIIDHLGLAFQQLYASK